MQPIVHERNPTIDLLRGRLLSAKKTDFNEPFAVRPGKVAYSNGCEARPGRSSQPLGSESLDRTG